MTHICVGNLTTIGSDNGLSPGRRQAVIWTNAGILLLDPSIWTNFSEILIEIPTFSYKKMRLKVSSAKWRPFCLGLNVLIRTNPPPGGGGALRVKISRGVRLEVQNGTQQDLNEIIDLVNFWGKKIVYMLKIGGFGNGTQQDLNKMVDMVKFWGAKRSSRCRKWGAKPRRIPTDSQRGSAPPSRLQPQGWGQGVGVTRGYASLARDQQASMG